MALQRFFEAAHPIANILSIGHHRGTESCFNHVHENNDDVKIEEEDDDDLTLADQATNSIQTDNADITHI